jgi:hypothetical protein
VGSQSPVEITEELHPRKVAALLLDGSLDGMGPLFLQALFQDDVVFAGVMAHFA